MTCVSKVLLTKSFSIPEPCSYFSTVSFFLFNFIKTTVHLQILNPSTFQLPTSYSVEAQFYLSACDELVSPPLLIQQTFLLCWRVAPFYQTFSSRTEHASAPSGLQLFSGEPCHSAIRVWCVCRDTLLSLVCNYCSWDLLE